MTGHDIYDWFVSGQDTAGLYQVQSAVVQRLFGPPLSKKVQRTTTFWTTTFWTTTFQKGPKTFWTFLDKTSFSNMALLFRIPSLFQDKTQLVFTKYSQRWSKDFLRKRLDWAFDALARAEGLAPPTPPRHLSTARCPCQYIEKHLGLKDLQRRKELESQARGCCGTLRGFFKEVHSL